VPPVGIQLDSTVTNGTQTDIEWSWDDVNRDEDGFIAEAKHGEGEWLTIPNEFPPTNDRTPVRFRLTTGETYYFRVRAFTGSGDSRVFSDYSGILTVIAGTTEPNDPHGKPDLIVSSASVTVTHSGKGDKKVDTVKATFTVTNQGTKEAGATHLYAKLTVPVPHKKPKKVTAKIPIPPLSTGSGSNSFTQEFTIPLTPAQYALIQGKSIKLIADGAKDVKELDEKNNVVKKAIP
jgi:hypothetical protein